MYSMQIQLLLAFSSILMTNHVCFGRVLNSNPTNDLSLSINNNNNNNTFANKSSLPGIDSLELTNEEIICHKLPTFCQCFSTIDIDLRFERY